MLELPTVAILGAGSMGRAILSRLLSPSVTVSGGIRTTNRSIQKAAALAGLSDVTALATESTPEANVRAVTGAGLVLVAVKPHLVSDLLRDIRDALEPGVVVVSVAAGVLLESFERLLPTSTALVRAMPNTPASIGLGVTGLTQGRSTTDEQFALVRRLFEGLGDVIEVPESMIDVVSSISGSGPAYIYYLIEQLTATAIAKGFTAQQAAILVNGTLTGSAALLTSSGLEPRELRRQVTSPNGTTERAIAVLEAANLSELFDRATDAAIARSRELSLGS